MKACAVIPTKRLIQVVDHPEPTIANAHQVKLRMLEVGVCGTDREIATFQYGTPPEGSDYLVIGHESLGEVVDVGSAVQGISRGDLVVTMVRRPCPHPECYPCRSGRPDFCITLDYKERGINKLHGFMTEFVVDEAGYMNVVPNRLRDVGVLTEPLTIAEKGIAEFYLVQKRLPWMSNEKKEMVGRHAVVLGAGPVGLLGAMALIVDGFKTTVCSREPVESLEGKLVQSIGGQYASLAGTTLDQVGKDLGQIDLVYEATGAASVAFDMMKYIGTNGVFIFTGIPGRKAPIPVEAGNIMRNLVLKNQVVFGTVNADKSAFEHAIRDLGEFQKRWPDAVRSLITSRHPIDQAADVILDKTPGIKKVITLGD